MLHYVVLYCMIFFGIGTLSCRGEDTSELLEDLAACVLAAEPVDSYLDDIAFNDMVKKLLDMLTLRSLIQNYAQQINSVEDLQAIRIFEVLLNDMIMRYMASEVIFKRHR